MAHRARVASGTAAIARTVETCCDQAVFTSAPSAIGEGYRVVASSGGVPAEEKSELTQRSPSHSSLCGSGDDAVGLTTSVLASGRICVASSVHAGMEHTGRGGQRVYTRALLLDPNLYAALGCDPVAVHVRAPVEVDSDLYGRSHSSHARLAQVDLGPVLDRANTPVAPPEMAGDGGLVRCVASSLVAGDSLVVVAPKIDPAALLEWALLVIPLPLRLRLSVSVGVRFSPSRRVLCTILGGDDASARKAIRGHGIRWVDASRQEPEVCQSSYDGWWSLVGRYWGEGRQMDLFHLARRFGGDAAPALCSRVAEMALDFDELPEMEPPALKSTLAKYQGLRTTDSFETELAGRIQEAGREFLEAASTRNL